MTSSLEFEDEEAEPGELESLTWGPPESLMLVPEQVRTGYTCAYACRHITTRVIEPVRSYIGQKQPGQDSPGRKASPAAYLPGQN